MQFIRKASQNDQPLYPSNAMRCAVHHPFDCTGNDMKIEKHNRVKILVTMEPLKKGDVGVVTDVFPLFTYPVLVKFDKIPFPVPMKESELSNVTS